MSDRTRQQLEKALLYIDQHLEEKVTAAHVAEHACISLFHFQRLFSAYLGETVSQYILHRRLEHAAEKITRAKHKSLSYIATSSGFETHSSFSRAFKKQFNVTPYEFRNNSDQAKLSSDTSRPFLNTAASKNQTIEVEIETLPTLWLNHKTAVCSVDGKDRQQNFMKIGQDFKTLSDLNKSDFFGLATSCSSTYTTRNQRLDDGDVSLLYGGIYTNKHDGNWSREWFEIEAGLWAVCVHEGSYDYTYQTWNNLIHSWLPESGYELRDTIHFGFYPNLQSLLEKRDGLTKKIYLPIKKAEFEQLA